MFEYQAKYRDCGQECCADWHFSPKFGAMREAVEWYERTYGYDVHKEIVFFIIKETNQGNQAMEDKKSEKDQILDELIAWRKHSEIMGMVEHWKFFKKAHTFIEKNANSPSKLRSSVNSEKDEILEELLGWQNHSKNKLWFELYEFFWKLFVFVDENIN
jgi:hypothetical protein